MLILNVGMDLPFSADKRLSRQSVGTCTTTSEQIRFWTKF